MFNDDILTTVANMAVIVLSAALVWASGRERVALKWAVVAAAIFAGHDFFLMNGFGLLPKVLEGFARNWQGKGLAVLFSLTIASLTPFGAKRCGITLRQCENGRLLTYTVAAIFLLAVAIWAATGTRTSTTSEDLLFQMTMPGLEEELFYRGVLLFSLDRAFTGRISFAGVQFGMGAVLVAVLFGVGHGFYYDNNSPVMDWLLTVNTGMMGLVLLWLRLRTGSVLLPIIVHSMGNLMPASVSGMLRPPDQPPR